MDYSNHIRTSSASTGGNSGRARAMSAFFEGYQTSTTAPTSPATSQTEYSSIEDDGEILEIDKETFEANVQHVRKDSCQDDKPLPSTIASEEPRIINGSTLGGKDPLHAYIRQYNSEPRWWIEERQRNENYRKYSSRPPTTKRKRSTSTTKAEATYLDPTWYDAMPYSRQDAFTSGLDMDANPESTSEEFWEKVLGAWKLSMRFESVDERRDAFDQELFPPVTPEIRDEFREEWFKEELTVGETW